MSRPRIRSLKPELWQDESVGRLGSWERLLFVGLITMADDEGRLLALPSMIQGHVFPWNNDAQKKLASWLKAIEATKMILSYEHNGVPYIAFRHWKRHQKITRPKQSGLPAPPDHNIVTANSVTDANPDHGLVTDSSVIKHEHDSEGSTLPRGSDPIPSLRTNNNDKGTTELDARKPSVDQSKPPSTLPEGLVDVAEAVLVVLLRVFELRGGGEPTLRGTGLAIAAFQDRDHLSVAGELEHWATAGKGQKKPVKDWAKTYRTFLETTQPGAPSRAGGRGKTSQADFLAAIGSQS